MSAALAISTAAMAVAALASDDRERIDQVPVRVVPAIALPDPLVDGPVSFEQAILRRGSTRVFSPEPMTLAELGQLLWSAQGERDDGRTAPSAGGRLPLEVYVAHEGGVYHYRPNGHEVVSVSAVDIREELAAAALDQRAFHTAPAVIMIAGVTERMAEKYGSRAERYVLIEVGHAAQNVLLQAATVGLGAVPTGAFRDGEIVELFDLPDGTAPWYLIPVGHPA